MLEPPEQRHHGRLRAIQSAVQRFGLAKALPIVKRRIAWPRGNATCDNYQRTNSLVQRMPVTLRSTLQFVTR